jgi:uncharacterized protein YjbJ (UPF0337 family)
MSFDARQCGLVSFGPASALVAAGGGAVADVCANATDDNNAAARMPPGRASLDMEISSGVFSLSLKNIEFRILFLLNPTPRVAPRVRRSSRNIQLACLLLFGSGAGRSVSRMTQMGSTSDKVSGLGNQAAGKVKEGVGKATGDAELETEGAAQNLKGKVQKKIGDAKSAVKDAVNKNL